MNVQCTVLTIFFFFTDDLPVTILGRTQILEQGDLLIADVKNTDAGKYSCVRQNEAGKVEASAYLSVLGKQC